VTAAFGIATIVAAIGLLILVIGALGTHFAHTYADWPDTLVFLGGILLAVGLVGMLATYAQSVTIIRIVIS